MILRLTIFTLVALAASTGLWLLFQKTYDAHRFASDEARRALAVSQEQSAELQASTRTSDMIAYGIFGAVVAAVSGLLCHPTARTPGRLRGALVGLVLGGLAGVAAAQLGHGFDARTVFPADPMVYWIERWALILLPLCLAVAIAVASAGQFTRHILDCLFGAVIGGALATIIYCVVSGALTPIEGHQFIFPAAPANRLLILGLAAVLIGGIVLVQLGRSTPQES
jgi:hypothetical protein